MPILPFGPWEPDSSGIDARDDAGRVILQTARNVYPTKTGYGPVPNLSAITPSLLSASGEVCVGLAFARQSSGGYLIFAGTRAGLFMYDSGNQSWTPVSRPSGGPYNVSTDDYWSFAQFGTQLIAVNIHDDPQVINVDNPLSKFAALPGSPPRARYVTVVG